MTEERIDARRPSTLAAMNHPGLKLSVFVNPEHAPGDDFERRMAEHIEQVELARSLGYDGVAIGHHMAFGSSVWFPPLETLIRLVPAAEGMSMATCMLVLPLFHPVHVAQQAAYLDLLTGGRFTLGIAPGWQRDEFDLVGIDHRRRISRFLESVDLIRKLWTGEPVSFSGQHFSMNGERMGFVPTRQPRPAMWFGGSVPAAVERVAGIADPAAGDSWVASSHIISERISDQAGIFNAALAARDLARPAEFPVLRNIVVAEDRATALSDAAQALERLIKGRVILGSPEEVAAELSSLRAAIGFNRLITRVQWMGLQQPAVCRSIELIAREVLPRMT